MITQNPFFQTPSSIGSRPSQMTRGSTDSIRALLDTLIYMGNQGNVIVLNGASSSGKTTLARKLQAELDTPFMLFSSDLLVDAEALPARRDPAGPFNWVAEMRPRFFDGFHRSIPAFAAAGNNLIVDHIIEYSEWRRQLADLLAGFDVFLVGVVCDLAELERREQARGDRSIGEARSHLVEHRIHELGPYDLTVDTTAGVTDSAVRAVVDAWTLRTRPSGLPAR